MPNVFVVSQPPKNRAPTGMECATTPAEIFGDIVYVFPLGMPRPCTNREESIERARDVLSTAKPGDFLLWAGGDPFGLAIAASILSDFLDGQFNYLLWDRNVGAYSPLKVDLLFTDGDDDE